MDKTDQGKPTVLTAADREAFGHLPEGWFLPADLSRRVGKNPFHRCRRLLELELLESRSVGKGTKIWTEYRKRVPFI